MKVELVDILLGEILIFIFIIIPGFFSNSLQLIQKTKQGETNGD